MNFSFDNIEKELKHLHRMQIQNDFSAFVKNTVHGYLDAYYLNDLFFRLQKFEKAVINKESPRLILSMPPRHLKSESATVRLPVFTMLNNPYFEIIIASANQELSNKFSRAARDLLKHEYVLNNWDVRAEQNNKSIEGWGLDNKSRLKAVGIGGQLNGFGAHIVIIDDPIKNPIEANSSRVKDMQYEWFETVASKRLAPGGGIIVILTRWAEDDIAGRLIKKFPDRWEVVSYKALAEEDEGFRKEGEVLHPTRFSLKEMMEIKESTSPQFWSALYQQSPRLISGNLFLKEYFDQNRYHESQLPEKFDFVLTSWDLPFSDKKTSDFVAGVTLGLKKNKIYVLNLIHGQFDFPTTQRKVLEENKLFKPNAILVEARANGQAIIDSIKNVVNGVIGIHPQEDKVSRANAIMPMLECGQILFPREQDAPWFMEFSDELLGFPRAPHDDIVDALTQGINYLRQKINKTYSIKNLDFSGLTYSDGFRL